jgi:hypothetical protein
MVSGPAVVLMSVAGGVAGGWPAGAAVRGAAAAPAAVSSAASAGRLVMLDALTQPAAAPAARPVASRRIARRMLARFGWSASRQFPSLNKLWTRESGWRVDAYNRHSGARGIPQADPGRKMSSAGRDWRSNARTQIRWGLRYIRCRYGSPRAAWEHEVDVGWY